MLRVQILQPAGLHKRAAPRVVLRVLQARALHVRVDQQEIDKLKRPRLFAAGRA